MRGTCTGGAPEEGIPPMIALRWTVLIVATAAFVTACGTSTAQAPAAPAAAPSSAAAPSAQPQPPAAQGPAVTVCQKFAAIYNKLSSDLNSDTKDPSALTVDAALNRYADDMAHWSHVIDQAIGDGTTSASVQFSNDLGDAGVATVQVAEPLGPGVAPDVQSAIQDVG